MDNNNLKPNKSRESDFEVVFNPNNYLYFYEKIINPEVTNQQIEFLIKKLKLSSSMKILDLACGNGRHATRLAKLGHSVVGLDTNKDMIEIAKKEAKQTGVNVKWMLKDMRKISYKEEFDRVLLLFTSFGFFDDKENFHALEKISNALRPKGLFCLDIPSRDSFLSYLHPYGETEREGNLMIDRSSFDPKTGRWIDRRIYIKEGKRTDAPFSVRLYNYTEIRDLLKAVKLEILDSYGDWEARPFTWESRRMIIIAEKK
jgi:SAM-dependent methyltransferase